VLVESRGGLSVCPATKSLQCRRCEGGI